MMPNHTYIKKSTLHRAMAVVLAVMLMLLCGCASAPQNGAEDSTIITPDVPDTPDTPVSDPEPDVPDVTPDIPEPPVSDPEPVVPDVPPVQKPTEFPPHKEIDEPFLVVVDAGHGGMDAGAVIGDLYEKDIDLAVALKVKALLQAQNVEVILTREDDSLPSLKDRYTLANESNADLFISLHCNVYTADPDISGLECYHRENAPMGTVFAQNILSATKATGQIRTRSHRAEDYKVLVHSNMPTVLVEMGFMTCPEELAKLTDDAYQQVLAQALVEGIMKTLNG
ncbi:MAG: N-acetylmuramoyl-L-alanine amidase [Oscillospiraceae bacterium]|nr:N-acetylmuramoyl-L-alanine amidase [Oscillospiraceae bacterium]